MQPCTIYVLCLRSSKLLREPEYIRLRRLKAIATLWEEQISVAGFQWRLDVQWTEVPSSKYGLTESINHLNTGENIKFALKKGPQYSAARIATCCHVIHKRLCRKTVSTSPTSRRTRREMLVGDRQYTVPLILSLILTFNSIRSLSSFPLSNHLPSLPRKRTKHNL